MIQLNNSIPLSHVQMLLGYLTAELKELHQTEVSKLWDTCERFLLKLQKEEDL